MKSCYLRLGATSDLSWPSRRHAWAISLNFSWKEYKMNMAQEKFHKRYITALITSSGLDMETSLHFALSCIYPSKKTKASTLQQSLLGVERSSKDDISLDDGWGLVHFLVEDRIADHSRCILHVPQRFVQPGIQHSVQIQLHAKEKFSAEHKTAALNLISSIAKQDRNAYFKIKRVHSHWKFSYNYCFSPFLTNISYREIRIRIYKSRKTKSLGPSCSGCRKPENIELLEKLGN